MAKKNQVKKTETHPFRIRDCTLVAIATGFKAQNLREFREGLLKVPASSIYNHFWGHFLQPYFVEPEYNNDFAAWAYHSLHEKKMAEKLAIIDPISFEDLESLREEVVEVVEERLDESEFVPWARPDQRFHFTRSQIVVFDTGKSLNKPPELLYATREMSQGSIFYHFIDARRRTDDKTDDFCAWLEGWKDKYKDLREKIMSIDPYFSSLEDQRTRLVQILIDYFKKA